MEKVLERMMEKMKNLTPEQRELMDEMAEKMSGELKELIESAKCGMVNSEDLKELRKQFKKLNDSDSAVFTHLCAVDIMKRGKSNMTCSVVETNLGHKDKLFMIRGEEAVDIFTEFVESSDKSWIERLKKIMEEGK